jgi:hypothetical protein
VNTRAEFWGLRHYDKGQATEDPTSPFGGEKTANNPNQEAIGLVYESDPRKALSATLTSVSGPRADAMKIEKNRFPADAEPQSTAGLHIQYRQLESGVMRTTYDLTSSRSLNWFFFVWLSNMGHAVYL